MRIHGLQKMTLLDYPGKVACTVFLGGCDFRCPFCHNSELLDMNAPALMDEKELLRFLKTRQGLLDGVCFTGGEPLMRKDLPDLFREIKALGFPIKLDTNGNRPEALKALAEEKLVDYVAMDIKNSPERYSATAGIPGLSLENIRRSIAFLLQDSVDYEFRTTVVSEFHDTDSFPPIGEMIRGAKRYFLQAFTDRDTVMVGGLHAPSAEEMQHYTSLVRPYVENVSLRGVG